MSRRLGDETIILAFPEGEYFRLDPVATLIWSRLSEPTDLNTIVSAVLDEFEIDGDTCEAEARAFLDELLAANLVSVISEP